MKKFGYTLAEILITLCVIGLISALMLPAINKAKPDSTKLTYLKMYDSLCQVVERVVNDSTIYSPMYEVSASLKYDVNKYPLLNFSTPRDTALDSIPENEYKLANVLKEAFDGSGTCTAGAANCTFTTPDGKGWEVTPRPVSGSLKNADATTTSVTYYDTVKVTFDETDFTFFIEADGDITPVDVQGQAYIKFRKKVAGKDDLTGITPKTTSDIKTTYSIGTDVTRL